MRHLIRAKAITLLLAFALGLVAPIVTAEQAAAREGATQARARPPAGRPPNARPPAHRPPSARPPAHRPPVHRPPAHRPPVRHPGWRAPPRGIVVVNPNRYWPPGGAIMFGAAMGFVAGAAAVSLAGSPPNPNMCWYYTTPARTTGFWDVCPW